MKNRTPSNEREKWHTLLWGEKLNAIKIYMDTTKFYWRTIISSSETYFLFFLDRNIVYDS